MSGLSFTYGVDNEPHPAKFEKGGEDAWLAQENLIVVSDGVSAWEKVGVDSGLFSKSLVSDIKNIYDANPDRDLKQILIESVRMNKNPGTATVVLAKLQNSTLDTTNLGDSGYLLYRPTPLGTLKLLFRSQDQSHKFNFPYTCGSN